MKKITILTLLIFLPFLFFGQIIVIDPGHGYDSNGGNPDGRTATEIVTALEVGLKLKTLITNGCPNWTTHMTRSTPNGWISLSQRTSMSNSWNGDYYLSIHCNGGGGTGTETFWCVNNDGNTAPDISFAQQIQADMSSIGQWTNRRCVEDDSYIFHLAVLSGSNATGCLNEIGFVDFTSDAAKLNSNTWRDTFANAYFQSFNTIIGNCSTSSIPGPVNDTCSNAISLTPNFTCVSTSGSLANATSSGMAKASCDGFGTPTLKDVWYKLTATAASHTITITPSADMDPVLSFYTSCGAGEIECSENGGLGVAETITASGLTVGTTYYIRVYDYGSLPPTTTDFDICITEPPFTTGITKENELAQFDVFPNPFDGSILNVSISSAETKKISFQLYDVIGREVFVQEVLVENGKCSLVFFYELSPGVYVLSSVINGNRFTKRVVVK